METEMNNLAPVVLDFDKINRLEVIDQTGRVLVRYLESSEKLSYSLQDDGRTLKVFVDSVNTDQ